MVTADLSPVRPAISVFANVNDQFIRLELMDEAGRVGQGVTVGAGKRLSFSESRADGGLGLLHVTRTGPWERQDTDLWHASVEAGPENSV